MIPSPYPMSGPLGPVPQVTIEQMANITAILEAMKIQFGFSDVMLIMKSAKKHADCGDPECDHYDKIILNLQLEKKDLQELVDNIKGFLL